MIRWFCQAHVLAETDDTQLCCTSAVVCAAEIDVQVWYRIRLASKPASVRLGIAATYNSPRHAVSVLVDNARRTGKGWTTWRAAA